MGFSCQRSKVKIGAHHWSSGPALDRDVTPKYASSLAHLNGTWMSSTTQLNSTTHSNRSCFSVWSQHLFPSIVIKHQNLTNLSVSDRKFMWLKEDVAISEIHVSRRKVWNLVLSSSSIRPGFTVHCIMMIPTSGPGLDWLTNKLFTVVPYHQLNANFHSVFLCQP